MINVYRFRIWMVSALLLAAPVGPAFGAEFDVSNSIIPVDEIVSGGPPKDGIPALTRPAITAADSATEMDPLDRVIGVEINGTARAYPLRILNWHEIVNDRLGGEDIAVTYCPLCGTGMVFDAVVDSMTLNFGVSGKLYNSDVLMYDWTTESLWSQILMKSVAGPMAGTELNLVASRITTWADWSSRHPQTTVLSFQTGHGRDYSRDPYEDYAGSRALFFPVNAEDDRLHPKAWVVGVSIGGEHKAWPFDALAASSPLNDSVGGETVRVNYDAKARSAWIDDADGMPIPSVTAFWFAWYAFHPNTALYQPPVLEPKGSEPYRSPEREYKGSGRKGS